MLQSCSAVMAKKRENKAEGNGPYVRASYLVISHKQPNGAFATVIRLNGEASTRERLLQPFWASLLQTADGDVILRKQARARLPRRRSSADRRALERSG